MHQIAHSTQIDKSKHYPSRSSLMQQDQQCPPVVGGGLLWRKRLSLASIAKMMNVPVVLATFRDENNVQTFATHGLDLMHNLARFAVACDSLCKDREVVIPDTRAHPLLGTLAHHWPSEDICFLVGIPLRDSDGHRVGSVAVMNTSRAVARTGISFRALTNLAKVFSQTGQLQPALAPI